MPATDDPGVAESWLEGLRGGVDGVVAKDAGSAYETGRRSKICEGEARTHRRLRGGRVSLGRGITLVASLLLGLYDARGELRHVGVAASFSATRRRELAEEFKPYVAPLAGHPLGGRLRAGTGPDGVG